MSNARLDDTLPAAISHTSESSASPKSELFHHFEPERDSATKDTDGVWDEGTNAWCTLVGSWLAMTCTFGYANAFGVYQDFYGRLHTASPSAISWIGSTQLFLLTSLGLFAGKLLDLGYFRWTMVLGSILYVFSLFMLSITHTDQYYQLFLSQGIGMGLGAGLIYLPTLAIQSHHWRKRRAMAIGIVTTGSAIGGIIWPIMLNNLLSRGLSFGWTVRTTAFIILGCLILANLLMRPRPWVVDSGETPAKRDLLKTFFTDVPYVFVMFGSFFTIAGVFYPYFYAQVFAENHDVKNGVGFYTLAILNAASIPGRILPNMLANIYGPFNVLLLSGTGCAVIIFSLYGINTVAGIVIFAIIAGFFSGAVISVITVVIASFARDRSEVGVRMGLAFFFGGCGALIGTPISGALLGPNFIWWRSITYSGVTLLVGTFLLSVSRHIVAMHKGKMLV